MKKVGYNRKRGNNNLHSNIEIYQLFSRLYLKLRGKIFPMGDYRYIFLKAVDLGINIF